MDISAGLIAKGALGAGALAAAGGTGYRFRDEISNFISSLRSSPQREEATTNDNAALNEKIKNLGIEGCELENTKTLRECELNKDSLAKVIFTNKGSTDNTITGLDDSKKVTLKIEKGYENSEFPDGLRFAFKNSNTNEVGIGSEDSSKITLKQGVSYDFKIKNGEEKLEKAWTLKTLGSKVGITCTNESDTECDLGSGINVWKEENDYITGANVDSGKKITVTKDSAGYNEGLKFTVNEEITLKGGDKKKSTDGVEKLTNSNMSYEIDAKNKDGKKMWFLIEKSTNVSG